MNIEIQILLRNALEHIHRKQLDEANALLDRAANLDPLNVDVLRLLAVVASKRFKHNIAFDYISRALSLAPNNAIAWSNKGNILKDLGRYEEALEAFDRSIMLDPNYAEAYNNRANTMQGLHLYEEALDWYDKAISIDPAYVEAYGNKGNTLEHLNRHQEAMFFYDKATALNPKHIETYWAKAHAQLSRGEFEKGWQNYEARWFMDNNDPLRFQTIPRLESISNLVGKNVLIWCEQGLGDTLQFCRYIRPLADLGVKVTFLVPKPLLKILGCLGDICAIIVDADGIESSRFDLQSPLLSLPLLFGTSLDSVPADIPYLSYDKDKKIFFENLFPKTSNLKVGVIWNGGFRPEHPELWEVNRRRNIDLEKIAKLQNIEGVDFYSLQKGDPAESELRDRKSSVWPSITDCARWLNDFSDTAALMECLDLIITVDTSSAHLAGALGKPVWILNRYDACWRWLKGRDSSPWYPTARLYQQLSPGEWLEPIDRVRLDLLNLVRDKS